MSTRARGALRQKNKKNGLPFDLHPLNSRVRQALGLSAVCVALTTAPAAVAERTPDDSRPDALYRPKLFGTGKEIVFIDAEVQDYERLTGALPHGLEIVLLDPRRDGLEQITEALRTRPFLDSVHLFSHGSPGKLMLGGREYAAADLERARSRLALWFSPLVAASAGRPDILVYGCNVGAGAEGKAFLDTLADLTGADVAASDDLTGSPLKGGDWELEVASGLVETRAALVSGAVDYPHTLATFTVTTNADSGAGSLRQAVLDANAAAGADTVVFSNVTSPITLTTGEIQIDGDLTIQGPGAATLTVSGNSSSRIFSVDDEDGTFSTVTISGLTLTDGDPGVAVGGAITNRENLTLRNTVVTGNTAAHGGGIAVEYGSLTLDNTTVSGNSAVYFGFPFYTGGNGGGIWFSGEAGSLIATNSTVGGVGDGNTADRRGGGAWIGQLYGYSGDVFTFTGGAIRENQASGGDGGGIYFYEVDGATVTFSGVTIADNSSSDDGGGLSFYQVRDDAVVNIVNNTTISGNSASSFGGGIEFYDARYDAEINIADSTVSGNDSGRYGGGISFYDLRYGAKVNITRSTISGNTASDGGGGIAFYDVRYGVAISIADTEVSGNTAYYDGGGINFYDVRDSVISVTGSRITDNRAYYEGGGIYLDASRSTVTIANTTFSGNIAGQASLYYGDGRGGALYADLEYRSLLTITDSTVTGNTAYDDGGGLALDLYDSSAIISNTTVSGNFSSFENMFGYTQGGDGGGLFVDQVSEDATLDILGGAFNGNSAGDDGGGIYLEDIRYDSAVSIVGSTVSGNYAGNDGGGIYVDDVRNSTLVMRGLTVSGNYADNDGGGIYVDEVRQSRGLVVIENTTVSGNIADDEGGGIYVDQVRDGAELHVRHSTVTGNVADDGGGIYLDGDQILLDHTIVAGNQALYNGNDLDQETGTFLARFSIIGDVSDGPSLTGLGGLITGVKASAVLDPELRNNGGPTLTHALAGGSRAIDGGDPTFTGPPVTDQRGFERVAGAAVDIGAVETGSSPSTQLVTGINLAATPPGQGVGASGRVPLLASLMLGLAGLWRRLLRRPGATS